MHPPVILPEDCSSLSPTFCSSLDPCSSHGFSSLQSPSAFPSFDSSQQIEAFQPLSLDSAQPCAGCHLRHCDGEAEQDGSASPGNLNPLSSQWPCLHHVDLQKHECQSHSSPKKASSRCCKALQQDLGLDCIPGGSSFLDSPNAENSISLPLSPSQWVDTECSAFSPFHDGCKEKKLPMCRGFEPHSPEAREHADLLHMRNSNDGGYALYRQIRRNQHFKSSKTESQIDDIAYINDGHITNCCYQNSCTMPPEGVYSGLTSLSHSVPGLITRHGDADDKENSRGNINTSRDRGVQLLDSLAPLASFESKVDCKREGKKVALQDTDENTEKTMYFPFKTEMYLEADEDSKENVCPQAVEQVCKRDGRLKADCNGWMCPKDAKKSFKPKPRQLMLDKWLTRQR